MLSKMPLICQMAVERLPEDKGKFAVAYVHTFNLHKACAEARVKKADALLWLEEPEVCTAIKLMSDKAMQVVGISYEWLLAEAKDIYMKAAGKTKARRVDRKTGEIIDDCVYDGFVAVKAHENLAKLCGHMGAGATNINVNIAGMSQGQREQELDRILGALEARQNAGQVLDAECVEIPEPETRHDGTLFGD